MGFSEVSLLLTGSILLLLTAMQELAAIVRGSAKKFDYCYRPTWNLFGTFNLCGQMCSFFQLVSSLVTEPPQPGLNFRLDICLRLSNAIIRLYEVFLNYEMPMTISSI